MSDAVLEKPVLSEPRISHAAPSRFKEEQYAFSTMSYVMKEHEDFEDCLKPEYWSQVAHFMQPDPLNHRGGREGGIIMIRREDHAFYAELYVRATAERSLVVDVVNGPHYLGNSVKQKNSGFEMKWNVGARGYNVVRLSDGAIVGKAEDLKTKEEATEFINKMR
jgi:hypothetical protein